MTISQRPSTWIVFTAALALAASYANHGWADAPAGQYKDMCDGTIYDQKTKLTWQQNVDFIGRPWSTAAEYCAKLPLPGSGWRVPSMKELQTIVDETRTSPCIDTMWFPSTPSLAFWTSSQDLQPGQAWLVNFENGNSAQFGKVIDFYNVRCVR